MYLLGQKIDAKDTTDQRTKRDLAVKEYLEEINEYRKTQLNRPDMRDAYAPAADFSIEQAIQWEQDFQRAVQDLHITE